MSEAYIGITDKTDSGTDKIRAIARSVESQTVNQQGITAYRAGILQYIPFIAQHLGDATITLPYTCKQVTGASASATQCHVLLRRPLLLDTLNAVNYYEATLTGAGSDQDNTQCIKNYRFFVGEKFLEPVIINGAIFFQAAVSHKTSAGTSTYQKTNFKLLALSANDPTALTEIVSVDVTVGTVWTNTTTTYSDKTIQAIGVPSSAVAVPAGSRLVLEISTYGKVNSTSNTATHKLSFDAGSSKTLVLIPTEEA